MTIKKKNHALAKVTINTSDSALSSISHFMQVITSHFMQIKIKNQKKIDNTTVHFLVVFQHNWKRHSHFPFSLSKNRRGKKHLKLSFKLLPLMPSSNRHYILNPLLYCTIHCKTKEFFIINYLISISITPQMMQIL